MRDLLACIETGKEPNCSGADALHALEIAMAMRESHRRGGVRVELPLTDRSLRIFSRETRRRLRAGRGARRSRRAGGG